MFCNVLYASKRLQHCQIFEYIQTFLVFMRLQFIICKQKNVKQMCNFTANVSSNFLLHKLISFIVMHYMSTPQKFFNLRTNFWKKNAKKGHISYIQRLKNRVYVHFRIIMIVYPLISSRLYKCALPWRTFNNEKWYSKMCNVDIAVI